MYASYMSVGWYVPEQGIGSARVGITGKKMCAGN